MTIPYEEFSAALLGELAPATPLEKILADEIVAASWRLQHCNEAESQFDFFFAAADKEILKNIQNIRAKANSVLHRSTDQLRKIQTSRAIGFELSEKNSGLVDHKQVLDARAKAQRLDKKPKPAQPAKSEDEEPTREDLTIEEIERHCGIPNQRLASNCNSEEIGAENDEEEEDAEDEAA